MKKFAVIGVCLIFLSLAVVGIWLARNDSHTTPVKTVTKLEIELKDGKLVDEAATYVVQPGVNLEFHIKTDTFGKVGVPTEPPQTITFTESPLIFQFTASQNAGNYALLYQADGSDQTIQIGTIVVRRA